MKRQSFIAGFVYVLALLGAHQAMALGFRNPSQDTEAMGQGEAFVGKANNPSSVWYNAGAMTLLKGTQVQGGAYFVLVKSEAELTYAAHEETDDKWRVLPQLYVVSDFGLEKWRFGLGLNSPFGLSADWGNAAAFREVVTKAELKMFNFGPSVAFQLTPQLSIGAGLNYYRGDTEVVAGLVPFSTLGGIDQFRFDGDGDGFGWNVGLHWRINDKHSFGAAYHSKVQIDFHGTETVTNSPLMTLPNSMSAGGQVGVNFPQFVTLGYAWQATPSLLFAVSVDWTGWEELNSFDLNSALVPMSIPLHWESSWFYEFGMAYKPSDEWTMRLGYIYSENSVPNRTFSPLLPDNDRHVFSGGLTYEHGGWKVSAAYQYTYSPERTINGQSVYSPVIDGRYKTRAHSIGLSAVWRF